MQSTNVKPRNSGKKQLFDNPVLESLSRTHISIPLVIFGGISSYLIYMGLTTTSLAAWQVAATFLTGLLVFTWVEYMVHRHVFHMVPTTKVRAEIQYKFHGVHHEYPKDKARLAMPPLVSIAITALLFYGFQYIMGDFVFGFLPGFLTGYASYLGVHYAVHAFRPPKNFLKVLWVHHGIHHYKENDRAYGVSSPLWDYIFRTMPRK